MPPSNRFNRSAHPDTHLADGAARYADTRGLTIPAIDMSRIRACPELGHRIAQAYQAAPYIERSAQPAYAAFREETWRQLDFLTRSTRRGGLGLAVAISRADPYGSLRQLLADLTDGQLQVWATSECGNPHPLLSNDDNDAFRAVHDAFGHGATGRGFDVHGEEAAWYKHSGMYFPLARRAMTTETRGQNCALIYAVGGTQFPAQKAVLLAAAFADPRSVHLSPAVGDSGPDAPVAAST